MTTATPRVLDLDSLILYSGGHGPTDEQMCVMEAVAFVAGEPWSDHPKCASKVIGDFLRSWNDGMNDDDRQMLVPLIPKLVGTAASAEVELRRSWMVLDWYCRVSAPAWLRLAGLTAEAEAIEATTPIVDGASASAAQEVLSAARSAAYKAGDAAWVAARVAARGRRRGRRRRGEASPNGRDNPEVSHRAGGADDRDRAGQPIVSATDTRMARPEAIEIAKAFVAEIEPCTSQLIVAGSLRRRLAHIGDIEIVAVPKVETLPIGFPDMFGGQAMGEVDVLDAHLTMLLDKGRVEKRLDANGSPRWGPTLKYLTYQGARVDLFTPHITCMKCGKMHTCTGTVGGQGDEANQEQGRPESNALQAPLRSVRDVLREHQSEGVQQELQHETGLQGRQEEGGAKLLPGGVPSLPGAVYQEGLLQDSDMLSPVRDDPVGTEAEGPTSLGCDPRADRSAGAVPSGVRPGSPSQGQGGLRGPSSTGDGAPHRAVPGGLGEGSPPQRGEDRQPDREPGDRHARSAQRLGNLPSLPKVVPGPLSHDGCQCPQCGGPIGSRFGWILMLRTGPAQFSRQLVVPKGQRTKDRRPGLMPAYIKASDGWLTYRTSGERIPTPDERSVFELFGLPYREPWERV